MKFPVDVRREQSFTEVVFCMDMTTLALDTYKRVRYPGEQKNVYDIALNDFMKLLMRAKFGNNFSKVYSWTMNTGRCLHVEY